MTGRDASVSSGPPPSSFAWIQSRLALERTLLAWVRTAASLIGFGFAIYHFFEALKGEPAVRQAWRPGASRLLGVSLVAIGTLALALALVQYLLMIRYLGGEAAIEAAGLARMPRFRPALIVAVTLTAVGVITFWAMLIRLPA
jgi:putative membrane protein